MAQRPAKRPERRVSDPWQSEVDSHMRWMRQQAIPELQDKLAEHGRKLDEHLRSDEDSFVRIGNTLELGAKTMLRIEGKIDDMKPKIDILEPVITGVVVAKKSGRFAWAVAVLTSKIARGVYLSSGVVVVVVTVYKGGWGVAWKAVTEFLAK